MKGIVFFKDGEFMTTMVMPESEANDFCKARGFDAFKAYDPADPLFQEALGYRPYREAREIEYPSVGDQLDRLTKALKYLRDKGVDIGPDGDRQIKECEAVKAKHPQRVVTP